MLDVALAEVVCQPDIPLCAGLLEGVEDSVSASRVERELVVTADNPESVVRVVAGAIGEESVV